MRSYLILLVLALTLRVGAAEDGFVSLFNGKDLSGWAPVNVAPSTFTVKEGVIACTGVPTGVMRTEKMYENFIVELEWRHLRPGGNSGFFVWSDAITSKGVPFTRAVENQILDGPGGDGYTTQGDMFAIHGATMTPGNPGKWQGRSYPTESRTKPSPEWNHYRIECRDGAIALAVNGKVVTTGKDVSQRKGYLCLESEGGLIEFRNIRVKELPDTSNLDPKFIAKADEGYRSMYTGVDLAGWKIGEAGKGAWEAKDWMLHYEMAGGEKAVLRNEGKVGDAEWIIDFRGKGPLELMFGESAVKIDRPEEAKPVWHRLHLARKAGLLEGEVDEKSILKDVKVDARGALALKPGATMDFANLYMKVAEAGK